jgi:toxin ParE1/3/4
VRRRTVIYTEEAACDLDWIYDTVAVGSSPTIAARYEASIREFCERLDFASERGSQRDDVRKGLRVIGFKRRVTIAFVVEADCVAILRIFYGGADWENELDDGAAPSEAADGFRYKEGA